MLGDGCPAFFVFVPSKNYRNSIVERQSKWIDNCKNSIKLKLVLSAGYYRNILLLANPQFYLPLQSSI
jgi:hypothetical protein